MMQDTVRYRDKEYGSYETPSQFNDTYEISEDGYLWFKECDHRLDKPGTVEPSCFKKENCRWRVLKEYSGRFNFFNADHDFIAFVKEGRIENILDISI